MGILLAILHFVVAIWAIMNIIGSGATPLAKVLWTLLVLVFPLVGLIVWFLAGPKSSAQAA